MKTLGLKFFSLAVALVISLTAFASDGGNKKQNDKPAEITESSNLRYAVYPVVNTQKIRLIYEKPGTEKVTVKIYDGNKKCVYTNIIKNSTNLKRNYDLKNLHSGEYTVVIKTGDFEESKKVWVGERPNEYNFDGYISPQVTNKKVRVAFQNAEYPVSLAVTNEKGDVIYQKTIHNSQNFSTILNMGPLKSGQYNVIMTSHGKTIKNSYQLN